MKTLIERDDDCGKLAAACSQLAASAAESVQKSGSSLYMTDLECERCGFGAFVVMDDTAMKWKLACVDCNLRMEGPALRDRPEYVNAGSSAPGAGTSGRLEFREGRYAGSSIAELAETVEGKDYLKWYAKAGKSTFMRERVAEFIGLLGD